MSSDSLTLPPSPCIGQCRVREDGTCAGCGRTALEISGWPLATMAEKLAIWQRLLSLPDGWRSSICERCGSVFGCGNSEACWCMELPRRALGEVAAANCLCPNCLQAALDK